MDKKFSRLDESELELVTGGVSAESVGVIHLTTCENFLCTFCMQHQARSGEASHICQPNGYDVIENICDMCEYDRIKTCSRTRAASPTPPGL